MRQDVMQVCWNGHVVTDLLRSHPERQRSHCEQCGAATVVACPTCGTALPGALPVLGLEPIGRRQPPQHCPACGAPFAWTMPPAPARDNLAALETLLRRLPRMLRALRPRLELRDQRDLEEVVGAALRLHSDAVWPRRRPCPPGGVAPTDFLLPAERIVVTVHGADTEQALRAAWQVALHHYGQEPECQTLVGWVYDPAGRLVEPRRLETELGAAADELNGRLLIAD